MEGTLAAGRFVGIDVSKYVFDVYLGPMVATSLSPFNSHSTPA